MYKNRVQSNREPRLNSAGRERGKKSSERANNIVLL